MLKRNVFTPCELQPTMDAIDGLVDGLANKLYAGGKVKNTAKDKGFYQRLHELEKQFPGASVLLHKNGVLPKAFADIWSHPRLLSVGDCPCWPCSLVCRVLGRLRAVCVRKHTHTCIGALMHEHTHALAHARTHARTHERTHALTH